MIGGAVSMELDDKIYEKIIKLCEHGDKFIENDNFHEAIEKYDAALGLIPLPKTEWETSTWVYTALGDAYFLINNYEKAKEYFYNAMNCPDGIGNPLILLRLGESLFECDELDKAKEYLLRAYLLEGIKIFTDEDVKYFQIIKEII